jgi:exodeoxyribonuclease-3
MKIISYNINGIRSGISKGFLDWLQIVDCDIICLQEIKATEDQIDVAAFSSLGYSYSYWFPAQKKGYSGVAILSKKQPSHVQLGFGNFSHDDEGRIIRLDIDDVTIVNVYIPSGSSGQERQCFKMEWLEDFYTHINQLKNECAHLIVCGDYNICHQSIDIHNPKSNANSSGFLPEERAWLGKMIDSGFIDTFRHLNGEPHHYTWWSYRANARAKNLGWRIDYQLVSESLRHRIKRAVILSEVKFSDHCPILIEVSESQLIEK